MALRRDVDQQVQQVGHEPLTTDNIEREIAGLREDLLNWDHGHPMEDDQ